MSSTTLLAAPPLGEPALEILETFALNGGLRVWAGPWEKLGKFNRHFFAERLPAVFHRSLELDSLPRSSSLDWVFTGDRAGVTISITVAAVSVVRRLYDSASLAEIGHRDSNNRYPEWRSQVDTFACAKPPRRIALSLDHQLTLHLWVDGKLVHSARQMAEMRRHQLQTENDETVIGRCLRPVARSRRVKVMADSPRQTMLGFGGTTIPTAFHELSERGKERYFELLKEFNLLIQREYPNSRRLNAEMDNFDDLRLAVSHYYGDSFPNSEISDFKFLKRVREIGGKIVMEFWYPPSTDPAVYARAMVRFCEECRDKTGRAPEICGVLNEWPHEAVFPEMIPFTLALREGLDRAGFKDTKIHMADDGFLKSGAVRAKAYRAHPEAWSKIDYTATHEYDAEALFTTIDEIDPLLRAWHQAAGGKPFLCNELTVLLTQHQSPDYRVAFCVAQLYHKNLVIADAVVLFYCWLLLNVEQPNFGWTRTLMIPDLRSGGMPVAGSHQLRVMGAYSRRIREGMRRLEVETDGDDLLVTAFSGERGERTLVAINRGVSPAVLAVDWPGGHFTFAEVAGPYSPNLAQEISPNQGGFVVEPGTVLTLSNVPLLR